MSYTLGEFQYTLQEIIEMLDTYSLDEIQGMYNEEAFPEELRKDLREYLYSRVSKEFL